MNQQEALFLFSDEIAALTGKKFRKQQITVLRNMSIQFYVNGIGSPVVPRPQFTSSQKIDHAKNWTPNVLGKKHG